MAISFSSTELINECRYPFRTPNPADTVTTIINELKDTENSIDSAQVNSEVDELATTKGFFGGTKNARPCLHIKLRDTEVAELKKFGCIIMPVEFGNLVYLIKYEYISLGCSFKTKDEMIKDIKVKLNSIDKWMEYTFIQTLGDYVYCEMLRKYDKNFDGNLKAYQVFFDIA